MAAVQVGGQGSVKDNQTLGPKPWTTSTVLEAYERAQGRSGWTEGFMRAPPAEVHGHLHETNCGPLGPASGGTEGQACTTTNTSTSLWCAAG